jgi:methylmalonyl-CoA epimerase
LKAPRQIAHIGIAVRSIDDALGFYRDQLGMTVSEYIDAPERGLRIAMLPCGEAVLELMEPVGTESQIQGFLDTRGPGIHHLCLQVDDIDGSLSHLAGEGVRLVNTEAVTGAEGCPVAFVHPKATGGVLLELLEDTGHP